MREAFPGPSDTHPPRPNAGQGSNEVSASSRMMICLSWCAETAARIALTAADPSLSRQRPACRASVPQVANANKRSGHSRTAIRVSPECGAFAHGIVSGGTARVNVCAQRECQYCGLKLSVSERKERKYCHEGCYEQRMYAKALVIHRYLKTLRRRKFDEAAAALEPRVTRTAAADAASKLAAKSPALAAPPEPPQRVLRKRAADAVEPPRALRARPASASAAPVPYAATPVERRARLLRSANAARGRPVFASSFIPPVFTSLKRTALRHPRDFDSQSGPSRASVRALCSQWRSLHRKWERGPLRLWRHLHNRNRRAKARTWQINAARRDPGIVTRTEAFVRATLRCIPATHKLQACKLLHSEPGAPAQVAHTDLEEGHKMHSDSISVLLHLHPTQTAWVQKDMALTGADLQHCPPDAYHQYAADAGTLFAFRTDVLHYGPANFSKLQPRVLVYLLFTPRSMSGAGSRQTFFCKGLASTVPD